VAVQHLAAPLGVLGCRRPANCNLLAAVQGSQPLAIFSFSLAIPDVAVSLQQRTSDRRKQCRAWAALGALGSAQEENRAVETDVVLARRWV